MGSLIIDWDAGPHGDFNTAEYEAEMRATAAKPGKVVRSLGDPEAAFANAAKVVSADYYQRHMVHAQMEPVVAVASLKDGKLEIWAPVQPLRYSHGCGEDIGYVRWRCPREGHFARWWFWAEIQV